MKKLLAALAFALFAAALSAAPATIATGYVYPLTQLYVSPSGSGNCLTVSTPCASATAEALAVPGTRINYAVGTYTGSTSMIVPVSSGKPGAYISHVCATDGGCLIDGQGATRPINVGFFDYIAIRGFNAAHGPTTGGEVMLIHGRHGIYQRLGLWDADYGYNYHIVEVTGNPAVLTGTITSGALTACSVTTPGGPYLSIPTLRVYNDPGSGVNATAHVTGLDANNGLAGCAVDTGGNGYTQAGIKVAPSGGGGAGTSDNLLEDIVVFGIGRKEISMSQGPTATTVRRAWAQYGCSDNAGPNETAIASYNSDNTLYDNPLLTWDAGCMHQQYLLQNNGANLIARTDTTSLTIGTGSKTWSNLSSTTPWTVSPVNWVRAIDHSNSANYMEGQVTSTSGTSLTLSVDAVGGSGAKAAWDLVTEFRNYAVDSPTAVLELGSTNGGDPVSVYGPIAYITATATHPPDTTAPTSIYGLIFASQSTNITLQDAVAVYPATGGNYPATFYLHAGQGPTGLVAFNLTSFKGVGLGNNITTSSGWTVTNSVEAASPAALYTGGCAGGTLYVNPAGSCGAAIRYRYVNGVLQDGTAGTFAQPLWPWPMNQRIIDATTASGHAIVDFDNAVRIPLFGKSPDEP